jgi:hypothetical protein
LPGPVDPMGKLLHRQLGHEEYLYVVEEESNVYTLRSERTEG